MISPSFPRRNEKWKIMIPVPLGRRREREREKMVKRGRSHNGSDRDKKFAGITGSAYKLVLGTLLYVRTLSIRRRASSAFRRP